MRPLNSRSVFALVVLSMAAAPAARAQWAVVDAPAIVQLIQEVKTMQQQLETAKNQLQSAEQAVQAMKGDRGMAQLLGIPRRNYLPSNWSQVTAALNGPGAGYAELTADVNNVMKTTAILSSQRLGSMSIADQREIQDARRWNAMQQALSHAALANASARFTAIQTLIAAISSAGDQKAALDLQARIGAELGMLQNEHTKDELLYQSTQAQESSMQQQLRERVIAEHGRFETRFQPIP